MADGRPGWSGPPGPLLQPGHERRQLLGRVDRPSPEVIQQPEDAFAILVAHEHDDPRRIDAPRVTDRRAGAYLKGGRGGLVGFELAGGMEAGRRFIDALKMFYHVANIGDARSLAIHPASTTHRQLTPEQQVAAGAGPDVVRLSVGIEDVSDIIADLEQSLAKL